MCEEFVCKYLKAEFQRILPERCFELENCEICPCIFNCRYCIKSKTCDNAKINSNKTNLKSNYS